MLVLAVLDNESLHGYGIAARLEEAGAGTVAGGTLYPVLKRLLAGGLVNAEWETGGHGPARKVYSLTPSGRGDLARHRQEWLRTHQAVSRVLGDVDPVVPEGVR